ncbi:MAG: peptidylprolyl isomerase, partial [Myxococcota bacterium]
TQRVTETRWVKEPLLHFAAIGALIFLIGGRGPSFDPPARVRIDARQIIQRYEQRTGAPASPEALEALIDREIEQALLFTEARALALDEGDAIVRRRLIQKMTLILDEAVAPEPPSDEALAAFLAKDARRFSRPPRRTLTHVFFRASPTAETQAQKAKDQLDSGASPQRMGEPFLRGANLGPVSESQLARWVDPAFARAAFAAQDDGDWFGPVRSTYGLHLVRIDATEAGRLPALDEIRPSVVLAWRESEAERRRAHALKLLRDKYDVVVTGAP